MENKLINEHTAEIYEKKANKLEAVYQCSDLFFPNAFLIQPVPNSPELL